MVRVGPEERGSRVGGVGGTDGYENPIVRKWVARIRDARQRRSRVESDWRENVRFLKGDFGKDAAPIDARVRVNLYWSTMRALTPSIYARNPDIVATAKAPQHQDRAKVVSGAV